MKTLMIMTLFILLQACAQKPVAESTPQSAYTPNSQEHMMMAINWFQRSGEIKALQYQAFFFGKKLLDEAMKKKKPGKKLAVVVDIDETVLDNSPYQAKGVLLDYGYPKGWDEWVNVAKAQEIAGAVDFLQYAHKNGFEVFYVSNRKTHEFDVTLKNLESVGFPVKKENMLLREKSSSKKDRREQIQKNFEITLLAGDNLDDFHEMFEDKTAEERISLVFDHKKDFETRFLVLPNPIYGSWEGALAPGYFKKTNEEKASVRKASLQSY